MRRDLFCLLFLGLYLVSGFAGAQPTLEVRAWLYDTRNTSSRSDDTVVTPYNSSHDYYVETGVDADGGLFDPARLNSWNKIWDVYSDNSTVYRLVFQIQSDDQDLIYDCDSWLDGAWLLFTDNCNWVYSDGAGVKELILTTDYNDGASDPDLITDYESGWWNDPTDIGDTYAPDPTKDITLITTWWSPFEYSCLNCFDGSRYWEPDAYDSRDTLDYDADSTMMWEIHFIVDSDWTDNDPIYLQLPLEDTTGGHSTDIRFRLQTSNPVLKWVYPDSGSIGAVLSSPTIRGGRVYCGSDDSKLYCLDASDGSLIWSYDAPDAIRSSAAPAYNSSEEKWEIYFGCQDGYVYALRDTGLSWLEIWTKDLGAVVGSSPALWGDSLYVGCDDDSIHCLKKSDGNQVWAVYLYGDISSSPAVNFDNIVYIGSKSDTLYALSCADGTVQRTYGTCGDVVAPAYITYQTGRLCAGSYASGTAGSDTMYVIDSSTFSTYWKYSDGGSLARTYTSCFSPNDTTLYFGNDNNHLYCLNLPNTSQVYKYDAGDDIHSSTLYWNGVVYFGSNNDEFYGLDDSNQQPKPNWPFVANGDFQSSPAISITDSLVVVGSSDGHIYGFKLE